MAERKTIEQQIAAAEARVNRLREQAAKTRRNAETRRKVMVGVAAEIEMERDPEFKARMADVMRRNLTKPTDLKAVDHWLATT